MVRRKSLVITAEEGGHGESPRALHHLHLDFCLFFRFSRPSAPTG